MTAHDPKNTDPNLRGGLSADYTDPEATHAKVGATHERMPAKTKSRAGMWVGLLAAVVVGLLITRMPFLAGSLNAGAPIDDMVTSSVGADGDEVDTSSALPEPDVITPSTVPVTE